MDADRRNNFINNKSVGVTVPTIQSSTAIENGSSNHSAANGTISSSTESSSDSVEPPKQPFNDTNNEDFHENNVRAEQFNSEQRNYDGNIVEKRTDSVQSNVRDSDVLCSVLSAGNETIVPDTTKLDGTRSDVPVNSTKMSTSPVFSRAQANSNHDKNNSLIDKQHNGDDKHYNSIDHQEGPCNVSNGIINKNDSHNDHIDNCEQSYNDSDDFTTTMSVIERNDKANTNGHQRINNGTNDIDGSIDSKLNETVTNTLHDNQLSKSQEDTSEKNHNETHLISAKLLVQNSSEDCISTDTISSNSIDVKPIKCPTDRSQTASESEEISGKDNEEIKSKSDDNITESNRPEESTMYDDNSLKMPLLGKAYNGNNNATVYSAIERPISTSSSKGNTDDNENCDDQNDNDNNVSGEKKVAYNEYVNLLCDTDRGGIFTKNTKRSASDENRPLLRQMSSDDGQKVQRRSNATRPRSIVKSPSTQNFGSAPEKFDVNRKPRLSIQCTGNDPERPVLHVQFLSQQHTDSNDSIKRNLINSVNSPSTGEHESYQNSGPQCDSAEKQPEELINQMPPRGILRTSRLRSSISSSSTESTSSSSDSSSSDDVSQFAEAKPPDGNLFFELFYSIEYSNLKSFFFFQVAGVGW